MAEVQKLPPNHPIFRVQDQVTDITWKELLYALIACHVQEEADWIEIDMAALSHKARTNAARMQLMCEYDMQRDVLKVKLR